MEIVKAVSGVRELIRVERTRGKTVGFVPTMGALHAGHMELVRRARAENDFVVVSIFVNPLQFGPTEDFSCYPRDLAKDTEVCRAYGTDLVFAPELGDMYPEEQLTHVEVDRLTSGLCGASRPGHFRGVTTVVAKLLNIVTPDRAYFGMKDAQQLRVIRRMVRDLNVAVEIVAVPTVREHDGLALSSRNAYLSPEERKAATVLWRALSHASQAVGAGERRVSVLRTLMENIVNSEPLATIDYIELVDDVTLQPVDSVEAPVLAALAVRIGRTRLIDNLTLEVN